MPNGYQEKEKLNILYPTKSLTSLNLEEQSYSSQFNISLRDKTECPSTTALKAAA